MGDQSSGTWLDDFNEYDNKEDSFQLYVVSFYWTITTITTVGYGDITANNMAERFFCSAVMLLGVISFSFANGSLSSILTSYDQQKIEYQGRIEALDKLQLKHGLPQYIYKQIKQSIGYEFRNSIEDERKFVD